MLAFIRRQSDQERLQLHRTILDSHRPNQPPTSRSSTAGDGKKALADMLDCLTKIGDLPIRLRLGRKAR